MTTRLFVTVFASLLAVASSSLAQESDNPRTGISAEDIVGPVPPIGRIACYQLIDEHNFCYAPDNPKMVNYTIPFNVIDLNGGWVDESGNRPYIYIYNQPSAAAGYTISVDLSLMNRPDGFGGFASGSVLRIYFPDDREYTGVIEANGRTIRWSNNTVWNKQ